MELDLKIGLKIKKEYIVTLSETANNIGSGNADVLATPIMITWMENTSMILVSELLPDGYDTVGTKIEVNHIAATPVGMKVNIEVELIETDGRKLVFKLLAYDELEKISEGTHERFVIQSEKFLQKVNKKLLAK